MRYTILKTFSALLLRDVKTFQQHILTRMIDACVWSGASLYVSQYLLPLFGINQAFGSFLITGNMAVWGLFEIGTNMSTLLTDLHGTNSMSYYLTLPMPTSLIFVRIVLIDAYKSLMPTIPMLLISKIILQDNFDLSSIYYGKLIITWIIAHILFGFFGLFISSFVTSIEYVTTIRQRILFPLWFLGCYQYTWHMLLQASPKLAYINLLNPVMYVMESMRSCTNTSQETLPYPLTMFIIICFTILFANLGISRFKKRLDCI